MVRRAVWKRRRRLTAEERPTRVAMVSTGRSVSSSRARVAARRRSSSQRAGGTPSWSANWRVRVRGDARVGGHVLDRGLVGQAREEPFEQGGQGVRHGAGGGEGRVLALAAPAVRTGGELAADAHGVGRAVLLEDLVKAEVEGGGRGSGGGDVAVIDVDDGVVGDDAGVAGGEFAGEFPVDGGAAAVQEAQGGGDEDSGADGDDAGASGMGLGDRVEYGGRGVKVQPAMSTVSASSRASRPLSTWMGTPRVVGREPGCSAHWLKL